MIILYAQRDIDYKVSGFNWEILTISKIFIGKPRRDG